jgi:DNA-binding transcriptional LysR family regulator
MELRQLEYFLAVVEHGTLTKAAAALHLAQPSLSQMIKTLERDLGTQLFHRVGRRLVLSPAGHVLIDPARVVLRDAATARATVAEVRGLTGGRLELASLSTLAVDPLAPLIGAFRRAFPRVAIGLLEPEDAGAVGALVGNGVCELGVGHLPTGTTDLVEHDLGEQELFVVLPPETPDVSAPGAPERALPLAELHALAWVASPAGTSTRTLLEQALATVGATPWIAVETAHREAIVPLVLAGGGATLLPASLARDAHARGAQIRPTDPPIRRRTGLIHRPGPLSPPARAFLHLTTNAPRTDTTGRDNAPEGDKTPPDAG